MRAGLIVPVLLACSLGPALPAQAHRPITTPVTWNREIVRVLRESCVGCHRPGGEAFSLTDYEAARAWGRAIRQEVLERRMPPWPAARGVGDFANDPSLSPYVIELIVAWVDGGMPLGDPADRPAPGTVAPVAPPRAQHTLQVRDRLALKAPIQLVAATPQARPGQSIEVRVSVPDGRREEIVFIPVFDRARTYWLRRPLALPAGAWVEVIGGLGAVLRFNEDTPRPAPPRPR